MKRLVLFLLTAIACVSPVLAQNAKNEDTESRKLPFSIKAYPFRGMYLDKNTHYEKFGPINPCWHFTEQ